MKMDHRTGYLWDLLSLSLLLVGLVLVIVLGSLGAVGLAAFSALISGSEIPTLVGLADQVQTSSALTIVAEILRGIGCLSVVALLLVRLDGQPFSLPDLGMGSRPNPLLMLLAGTLSMAALFAAAASFGALRGEAHGLGDLAQTLVGSEPIGVATLSIGTYANAFWQELAFRAYLQPRLQRSFGLLPGVLACSFLFVVLHGLLRPLGIQEIVAGTILFSLVGWLYFVSGSLALATSMHATGNILVSLLDEMEVSPPAALDRGLAYALALAAVLLFLRRGAGAPQVGAV